MKNVVLFDDEKLLFDALQKQIYHFTSASSLFKILEDLTLIMTPCKRLNDLNEVNLRNFEPKDTFVHVDFIRRIETECYVGSFSKSYQVQGRWISGVNRPSMWAYYGANLQGACIVLDREKFVEINRDRLSRYFYRIGDVEYKEINAIQKKNVEAMDFETLLEQYSKELFFTKHISWEREDEWRVMLHSNEKPDKLSIDGCIEYIALGSRFFDGKTEDKENLELLVHLLKSNNHDCLAPHSFAKCMHSSSGYSLIPISGHIAFKEFYK